MPSWNSVIKNISYTWKNHLISQVATFTVLSATLAVVFSILSLSLNLSRIMLIWGDSINVTAYLKDSLESSRVSQVEQKLKEFTGVGKVSFVSKDDAQRSFAQHMTKYSPALLNDPDFTNPFPASFKIELSDHFNFEQIDELAKRIATIQDIEDVSYGQDWVDNYASLVGAFSSSGWIISVILLIGSTFVIANAIRTSINHRREEIEILELVGATRSMIWIPFVADGVLVGFCSSILALLAGYFVFDWGLGLLNNNLSLLGMASHFYFLDLKWIFFSVVVGTSIGGLSSYFCARSLLKSRRLAE